MSSSLSRQSSALESRAEALLRAHWTDTDWDGDVEAVKRLNPVLWASYVQEARETFENSAAFRCEVVHGNEDGA